MNLMEIKISEEALVRELHEAIIKSALGQTLAEVVKSSVNGYQFKSAVDKAITLCVEKIIAQHLLSSDEFKNQVAKAVNEGITDEVIRKLIDRALKLDKEY